MKKILMILIASLFVFSLVSAGVDFSTQPNSVYNLGDYVYATLDFDSNPGFASTVDVTLVCGDKTKELYREFLVFDESRTKEIIVPLIPEIIDGATGNCYLQVNYDGEKKLVSDVFRISKLLKITLNLPKEELLPGENYNIGGTALRESGAKVDGELFGNFEGKSIDVEIIEGSFNFNLDLDGDFPSGEHIFNLTGIEKDKNGVVTNIGRNLQSVKVAQVPTSLEVVLENQKLIPGEVLKGKIILHDQAGAEIDSKAYVKLEDVSGNILQKFEVKTGEEFEYEVNDTQIPVLWTLAAYSEEKINRVDVEVVSYPHVQADFVNDTLVVKNDGNVFFNDSIEIQIGKNVLRVPISLGMGDQEQYVLSAPDGEYVVKVGGIEKRMTLTGNAVSVEKLGQVIFQVHPLIWIFIILVFAFVAYLAFRKGRPKEFITKIIPKRKKVKDKEFKSVSDLVSTRKKLELSLSIVGVKQNASVGCISLKNYEQIKSGQGNVKETLSSIANLIDSNKGLIYRNNGNIFFILAPSITKTFKNQQKALEIILKIKEILLTHNKKFKQKIDFGLSLNFGTIVTKEEQESVKFMSMGTLMTVCKKLANYSKGEVYISDKFKEKLEGNVRGEKVEIGNIVGYKFDEIIDKNKHNTFIEGFLDRQKKDRLAQDKK